MFIDPRWLEGFRSVRSDLLSAARLELRRFCIASTINISLLQSELLLVYGAKCCRPRFHSVRSEMFIEPR
jgi:hypothetical protein